MQTYVHNKNWEDKRDWWFALFRISTSLCNWAIDIKKLRQWLHGAQREGLTLGETQEIEGSSDAGTLSGRGGIT